MVTIQRLANDIGTNNRQISQGEDVWHKTSNIESDTSPQCKSSGNRGRDSPEAKEDNTYEVLNNKSLFDALIQQLTKTLGKNVTK